MTCSCTFHRLPHLCIILERTIAQFIFLFLLIDRLEGFAISGCSAELLFSRFLLDDEFSQITGIVLISTNIICRPSVSESASLRTLGGVLAVKFRNALCFGFVKAGFRRFGVASFHPSFERGGVRGLPLSQNLGDLFIDVGFGEHAALLVSFGPRSVFLTWTLGVLRPVRSGGFGTSGFNR